MSANYTVERNAQMLIYLLKAHGVKKIVVSPGATNVCFVASIQTDSFFEIYSSADERSAAYIACGLAAESEEPVAISCTGATASRNYVPALTEAFYRKLPVLAITSSRALYKIGQLEDQVTDRTCPMRDIALLSVQIPTIHTSEEEHAYGVQMNRAILELQRHSGGPVHINLVTTYDWNYNVTEIRPVKVINRICLGDSFPEIRNGKIGIFVGSHGTWSEELEALVDAFCEKYNAVVHCDVTGNYRGKYGIPTSFAHYYTPEIRNLDLMIHLGEIAGMHPSAAPNEVWRVNPDGEIRDTFHKLRYVYEMREEDFFRHYVNCPGEGIGATSFYEEWRRQRENILAKLPELPFSNAWIAQFSGSYLPENAVLHFGILNSLRSWNLVDIPKSVLAYSNTGGYGIDGCVSSLIGASLVNPDKIYFGFVGDLAFFYDMNSLGNHHIRNNIRLLIVNNGRGVEFHFGSNPASQFGDDTGKYIAAAGHYGNQSPDLVRHYAEDLGFLYLKASSKEEFEECSRVFFSSVPADKPIVFEAFVDYQDDVEAVRLVNSIEMTAKDTIKNVVKNILGQKTTEQIKRTLHR